MPKPLSISLSDSVQIADELAKKSPAEQAKGIMQRLKLYAEAGATLDQGAFLNTSELQEEHDLLQSIYSNKITAEEKQQALASLGLGKAWPKIEEAFAIMDIAEPLKIPDIDATISLLAMPEQIQAIRVYQNQAIQDAHALPELGEEFQAKYAATTEKIKEYQKSIQVFRSSITDKTITALGNKPFRYDSINPLALIVVLATAMRHGATEMSGANLVPVEQIVFGHEIYAKYRNLSQAISDLKVTPMEIADHIKLTKDNGNKFGHLDLFSLKLLKSITNTSDNDSDNDMLAKIKEETPAKIEWAQNIGRLPIEQARLENMLAAATSDPDKAIALKLRETLEHVQLHAKIIGYTELENTLQEKLDGIDVDSIIDEVRALRQLAREMKGLVSKYQRLTTIDEGNEEDDDEDLAVDGGIDVVSSIDEVRELKQLARERLTTIYEGNEEDDDEDEQRLSATQERAAASENGSIAEQSNVGEDVPEEQANQIEDFLKQWDTPDEEELAETAQSGEDTGIKGQVKRVPVTEHPLETVITSQEPLDIIAKEQKDKKQPKESRLHAEERTTSTELGLQSDGTDEQKIDRTENYGEIEMTDMRGNHSDVSAVSKTEEAAPSVAAAEPDHGGNNDGLEAPEAPPEVEGAETVESAPAVGVEGAAPAPAAGVKGAAPEVEGAETVESAPAVGGAPAEEEEAQVSSQEGASRNQSKITPDQQKAANSLKDLCTRNPEAKYDLNYLQYTPGSYLIRIGKGHDLINQQHSGGNTLLMFAAQNGHTEIVNLLLAYGANPEAKNNYQQTALELTTNEDIQAALSKAIATKGAAAGGSGQAESPEAAPLVEGAAPVVEGAAPEEEVKKAIIQSYEDNNIRGEIPANLIAAVTNFIAAAAGENRAGIPNFKYNLNIILASSNHSLIDIKGWGKYAGKTALMLAAEKDKQDIVELLLQHKANPEAKNNDQQTALELTTNPEIIAALKKAIATKDTAAKEVGIGGGSGDPSHLELGKQGQLYTTTPPAAGLKASPTGGGHTSKTKRAL